MYIKQIGTGYQPAPATLTHTANGAVHEIINPTKQQYAAQGYFEVQEATPPEYDPRTHTATSTYTLTGGIWVQQWMLSEIPASACNELRAAKLAEINAACEEAIYAGVDVETTKGTEHFSLTANDQINIAFYEQQIAAGASHIPYHADGRLCRMFTAAEIRAVAEAAARHKVYHLTYCNHLRVYIAGLTDAAAIVEVTYGMMLSEELQGSLDGIMYLLGGNPPNEDDT